MLPRGVDFRQIWNQFSCVDLLSLLLQHFAVTDDGVQRRAQFVAHPRDELAFRAARLLSRRFLRGLPLTFADLSRQSGDKPAVLERHAALRGSYAQQPQVQAGIRLIIMFWTKTDYAEHLS